ncbi:MAG: protein translocase subunit SecD [Eubacteriales bacterium]
MNGTLKKFLAILVIIVIAFGWVATIAGVGPIKSASKQIKLGLDIKGGVYVVMEAQTDLKGDELKKLMDQTQAVIEQRVNQMGLSEPVVTVEGEKRIRVELPGAEDADEAIKQIGKTAQLQFFLADGTLVLDGGNVKNAGITKDTEHGGYAVSLEFDSQGSSAFASATEKALSGSVTSAIKNVSNNAIVISLDDQIISAPVVHSVISDGKAIITSSNGYPQEEAATLSALIRGGALPVALKEIETSTRTASIGFEAFEKSVVAGAMGIALIILIMLVFYGIMGVAASAALLLYVIMIIWTMIAFGSVLTLPGIAGIILSVGMAVDANVIIFSRIREEIGLGKSVRVAVQIGFRRALSTILDSQITTMIASIVLYQFGTGPVKGFAMTLMMGIIASIFTATVITQLFLSIISDTKAFSKKSLYGMNDDNTCKFAIKRQFDFLKNRKLYYIAAVIIIVGGIGLGVARGYNYGIDFTGGTMMQLDMGKQVSLSEVKDTVKDAKLKHVEAVYAGKNNEQVIIRTTSALDNDERIDVLGKIYAKFGITEKSLINIDQFGPSVGNELRMNAIKSVLIAAIGMLIYIVFRFEWKFGVASIAGIAHDVLMVLALYGIFHISINSPFIAGILTVVGYSINDTIVIFDRIRENLGLSRRNDMYALINTSINQTVSRSIMTSATTLVVMVPMLLFTGSAIREFMLPLLVGVSVGTLSSIFMCSPIYYELSNLTNKSSKYIGAKKAN